MENARLNGTIYVENNEEDQDNQDDYRGRSKSIGVGGGLDDQSQMDSEDGREEDESDNGGGGGDYSTGYVEGGGGGEYDSTSFNFNNLLGDSMIPVFDNLPISTTTTTNDANSSQLDALTSLANLASSLSPQRQPPISLPPALSTTSISFNNSPNFLNNPLTTPAQASNHVLAPLATNTVIGNGNSTTTITPRLGSATSGNFTPKLLARIPMIGETPRELLLSLSLSVILK